MLEGYNKIQSIKERIETTTKQRAKETKLQTSNNADDAPFKIGTQNHFLRMINLLIIRFSSTISLMEQLLIINYLTVELQIIITLFL